MAVGAVPSTHGWSGRAEENPDFEEEDLDQVHPLLSGTGAQADELTLITFEDAVNSEFFRGSSGDQYEDACHDELENRTQIFASLSPEACASSQIHNPHQIGRAHV